MKLWNKIAVAGATLGVFSLIALNPATLNAQELNQTLIRALDLHISSKCEDGSAIFQVRNVGTSKIKSASFLLFKVKQDLIVSKRRMSLKQDQSATFKVKNADMIPDQIGLFVESKSVARERKVDIAIKCSE